MHVSTYNVNKKIMFENKTKVLVVIFVLIPLLITFMASPLIVQNERTRVLMYVKWQPPGTDKEK